MRPMQYKYQPRRCMRSLGSANKARSKRWPALFSSALTVDDDEADCTG